MLYCKHSKIHGKGGSSTWRSTIDLTLTVEKLIMDESPLSPQKEVDYRTVIRLLEQELEGYKKLVYGQKSEKTEVVLENGEQIRFF